MEFHGAFGDEKLLRDLAVGQSVRCQKCDLVFSAIELIVGTVGWLVFHRNVDLAVLLVLSLVSVQFWNVRLSLEYQPCFLLAFALSLLFLATEKKNDTWLIGLSILGGVSVCFFDFLTTETLVILLPLILVTAVRAKEIDLAVSARIFSFI